MSSSLVISNFATGYETDREPFLINNDAFPVLNNMFVWRGRLRKKRGTSLLGRLERGETSVALGSTNGSGLFTGNIITILSLDALSSFDPASFSIVIGGQTFTDTNGVLSNGGAGTGAINYATGVITIQTAPVLATTAVVATFSYFPNLPVMGLEDFQVGRVNFPNLVAFDTEYSYQYNQTTSNFYDVTFYAITGLPFTWDGADYQQFWTTNWAGSMWACNEVDGFNYLIPKSITPGTVTTFVTNAANPLVTGDMIFVNEVTGTIAQGINLLAFSVTVTNSTTFTIDLNSTGLTVTNVGLFQLLTNSTGTTGNGIKFYYGDPTTTNQGWVNFAPPLSNSVNPPYLVGARAVVAFKNRLLFFGPIIVPGNGNFTPIPYPNRFVYSQDGTPYYNSLVPPNQTSNAMAWFQNVAGFGGFLGAPISQYIVTIQENEDVLLTGFESKQLKLLFTGDDTLPFVYQTINSELGSQSTFSGINLDTGAITIGDYGIALTTQVSAQRIDLQIPDQVFDISSLNNGNRRVTAIRDYRNEFIYFSYPPKERTNNIFNSKTLLYNYRDNTWATLEENFTHYGTFRYTENTTWATLNQRYPTWAAWTDPWNFGSTGARYPHIVGGTQQGFVLIKDDGTYEAISQYISAFDTSTYLVTSPNHCLNDGDYIEIFNAIGVNNLNEQVYLISVPRGATNTFTLQLNSQQLSNPPTGTYLGNGVYRRLTNINVMTKQFPIYWESARKTRIGTQRYLLDNAEDGQLTANIFTSQNSNFPSSDPNFAYLIQSNILLSSPDPLKPFESSQAQIWHRMSNSFNGDTVQIGFSLNDAQMRNNTITEAEITIHAIAIDLYPGPILV
jgi:hypothetical protein